MKKLTTLIITSLLSISANAANWMLVGGNETMKAYIDLDSLSQSNDIVKAFTKYEFEQTPKVDGISHDKFVSLEEIHCYQKPIKSRALSGRSYIGDKEVFTHDGPTEFTYDYPDTIGKKVQEVLCAFTVAG